MKKRHAMLLLATLVMALAMVVPASAQDAQPPNRLFLPAVRKSEQVLTLTAVADAFVFENGPDINTGSETLLFAGNDQSEQNPLGITRSFIRFNLPALQSSDMQKAVLRVFYAGYGDYPDTARLIAVGDMQEPWDEATITWANHPRQAADATTFYLNSNQPFGYVEVEVSDVVRGWLTGHQNYGIRLAGPETAGSDWSYRVFASRESQFPPQLVLTLN